MFFIRLLGLLDVIAALLLVLAKYNLLLTLSFAFGVYVIVKSLIFFSGFTTTLDVITGIFLILSYFGFYTPIAWIFVLWMLQKGLLSLVS